MAKTISNNKTLTVTSENENGKKTSGEEKKSSGANKKQGALNLKIPSARDKAKAFDEGRRNDANSNEL